MCAVGSTSGQLYFSPKYCLYTDDGGVGDHIAGCTRPTFRGYSLQLSDESNAGGYYTCSLLRLRLLFYAPWCMTCECMFIVRYRIWAYNWKCTFTVQIDDLNSWDLSVRIIVSGQRIALDTLIRNEAHDRTNERFPVCPLLGHAAFRCGP